MIILGNHIKRFQVNAISWQNLLNPWQETDWAEFPTRQKKKVRESNYGFFPKGDNAKNPDSIVFTMLLDETDKEKILKLFE